LNEEHKPIISWDNTELKHADEIKETEERVKADLEFTIKKWEEAQKKAMPKPLEENSTTNSTKQAPEKKSIFASLMKKMGNRDNATSPNINTDVVEEDEWDD